MFQSLSRLLSAYDVDRGIIHLLRENASIYSHFLSLYSHFLEYMHNTGYKSALARRVCRYSDARPPRKTDGVLLESEIPPHMRGKRSRFKRRQDVKGSPPHMRGKGKSLCDDLQRVGITPAYAGKSTAGAAFDRAVEDHPRICGEKRIASSSAGGRPGSPPHMRGKANDYLRMAPDDRITPAYAGKSTNHWLPCSMCWDHPRICGEKTKKIP